MDQKFQFATELTEMLFSREEAELMRRRGKAAQAAAQAFIEFQHSLTAALRLSRSCAIQVHRQKKGGVFLPEPLCANPSRRAHCCGPEFHRCFPRRIPPRAIPTPLSRDNAPRNYAYQDEAAAARRRQSRRATSRDGEAGEADDDRAPDDRRASVEDESRRDLFCRRDAARRTGYTTPADAARGEQARGTIGGTLGGAALGRHHPGGAAGNAGAGAGDRRGRRPGGTAAPSAPAMPRRVPAAMRWTRRGMMVGPPRTLMRQPLCR